MYEWILSFGCSADIPCFFRPAYGIIKPHPLLENGSYESNGNWRNACIIGCIGSPIADDCTICFGVSGFQDLAQSGASGSGPVHVPAHAAGSMAKMYHPDPNTNFMCGSPNGNGQSCPEGTFCDGLTQSCVPTFVGGAVPDTGYYS